MGFPFTTPLGLSVSCFMARWKSVEIIFCLYFSWKQWYSWRQECVIRNYV